MRSICRHLALPTRFDVVLAQDATGCMTSIEDLRATIATASRHLRPGGVAIFIPDDVKDTFEESTKCGGHTADDGRALRFLEWTYDPDPGTRRSWWSSHSCFVSMENLLAWSTICILRDCSIERPGGI